MRAAGEPEEQAPTARPASVRRMRRVDRHEQILDAATRAFARTGYAATSLDDIAGEAGITRVILYRHFDSKKDMYRAALDRAGTHLATTVGTDNFDEGSISALLQAAAASPDGFRLMFRHAVKEPEFQDVTDKLTATSTEVAYRHLAKLIDDERWANWAARVIPTMTIEAVIAWLDIGQPDAAEAADRIGLAVHAVIRAAQHRPT